MQPLGLGPDGLAAYHARILSSHDFDVTVELLDAEERLVAPLTGLFIDGQKNYQRDSQIRQTATVSILDEDGSVHLDRDSPYAGAMFADKMIRVRHSVDVPDFDEVESVAFVGPVTGLSREAGVLEVSCQDKAAWAVRGTRPMTVRRGMNAVEAIEQIMRERCGERRFRLPTGLRQRLGRAYSVGWTDEASPWAVCQRIARNELGRELLYATDGALILRRTPKNPVITLAERHTTTWTSVDYDLESLANHVRVTGATLDFNGKKKGGRHVIAAVAEPRPSHDLSPESLGRNGVPRYLPLLVEDSELRQSGEAQARADRELRKAVRMEMTASFSGLPLFHLDHGDIVEVETDRGTLVLPLVEGSVPFALGGDASYGQLRRVMRTRRRRGPYTNMPRGQGPRRRRLPRTQRSPMPRVRRNR